MTATDSDAEFTPRIAILGAGPIGLEAAIYARYLGFDVAVFDRGTIANNVLQWGHVRMFSPFSMNSSTLGVAALKAQHEDFEIPNDALLTGREYAEQYLTPLANSDLIRGCVHQHVEVLQIGRDGILKTDTRDVDRSDFGFRVLVRSAEGEDIFDADVVIDSTGVFNQTNFLGHGGIPAVGELDCREYIWTRLPDVLGKDRTRFENKRVLVVGSGYSAATNIVALGELKSSASDTKVTWVTRRESTTDGPLPIRPDDPLPQRSALSAQANASECDRFDQTSILGIERTESGAFSVSFGGKLSDVVEFDEVIASVGFRPDMTLYEELQIDQCPASQAPKQVAEWFDGLGVVDAVDQKLPPRLTCSNEPGFFVLGSKSFGRNSNFLLRLGLDQIRDAFSIIADRDDLDLYSTLTR